MGALLTLLVARRRPDVVLISGSFAAIAGGSFTSVTLVGQYVLVIGGASAALSLASKRGARIPGGIVLAVVLLVWLAARLVMETGGDYLTNLAACFGTILLVLQVTWDRPRLWISCFTWISLLFLIVSWLFGTMDPTGMRFEGISGNANRFSMGALVAAAVLINATLTKVLGVPRLVGLAGATLAIWLILQTGSDQALAGLVLLSALAAAFILRSLGVAKVIVAAVGVGFIALTLFYVSTLELSQNLLTLSGRTGLYAAGWDEFLANPVIGTGQLRITGSEALGRSSHSSTIGIAATSGLLGLAMWVALLLTASWRSLVTIMQGFYVPAAALTIVASQFVQQVELIPLTWMALLLCSSLLPTDESVAK